jgi:histidine ammonia-lyase
LREAVPGFGADRWLSPELGAAEELVGSGALIGAVEETIGELG